MTPICKEKFYAQQPGLVGYFIRKLIICMLWNFFLVAEAASLEKMMWDPHVLCRGDLPTSLDAKNMAEMLEQSDPDYVLLTWMYRTQRPEAGSTGWTHKYSDNIFFIAMILMVQVGT